jgi:hypothetical protein
LIRGLQNTKTGWRSLKFPFGKRLKIYLREVESSGIDWINLAGSSSELGNELSGSIKFWEILE